jgi:hypothetical protein
LLLLATFSFNLQLPSWLLAIPRAVTRLLPDRGNVPLGGPGQLEAFVAALWLEVTAVLMPVLGILFRVFATRLRT